ncbi:MAG: mevalonate kinase [Bacillota bacterium]|nr:mevalonate kinase [Bacillota bacterium]
MVQLSQKVALGKAHGKLILVGEHSVVYGKPAIALPFPLIEVKSFVEEIPESIRISCDYYDGYLSTVPNKMKGIAACVVETLKVLTPHPKGLLIRLESTIPLGRGLGSSAAVAIAIVRSLFTYYKRELNQKVLSSLVNISETHAHGNPSGIDMAAASGETPIWFQKDREIDQIQIGAPIHLVVADSGRVGDTLSAVSGVKEKYKTDQHKTNASMEHLEEITYTARTALSGGHLKILGHLLDLAQEELTSLGVSDDGINKLVHAARKAGALGAKLTGGGRGGCVIALAKNASHAKSLAKAFLIAGASKTWNFSLGNKLE